MDAPLPSFVFVMQLEMINEFDLAGRPHLWGGSPCVRSVCLNDHSDGRKILIGTSCSEVGHTSVQFEASVDVHDSRTVTACVLATHLFAHHWDLHSRVR